MPTPVATVQTPVVVMHPAAAVSQISVAVMQSQVTGMAHWVAATSILVAVMPPVGRMSPAERRKARAEDGPSSKSVGVAPGDYRTCALRPRLPGSAGGEAIVVLRRLDEGGRGSDVVAGLVQIVLPRGGIGLASVEAAVELPCERMIVRGRSRAAGRRPDVGVSDPCLVGADEFPSDQGLHRGHARVVVVALVDKALPESQTAGIRLTEHEVTVQLLDKELAVIRALGPNGPVRRIGVDHAGITEPAPRADVSRPSVLAFVGALRVGIVPKVVIHVDLDQVRIEDGGRHAPRVPHGLVVPAELMG